jgi:2-(1,2-epoxy-1,2-dihydrophenyl)acetyl-CoA isomerase
MSIRFHLDGPVAVITLDRPDKKNAMLLSMRDEIAALCERVNDDPAIRVAILTGAGSDFCSGADVSEMGQGGVAGSTLKARHMERAIVALGSLQKPLIGAIRGVAVGMGLSMALACDVVLATASLRMGCVQRKIGLCPDAGNVWFLQRQLGAQRAKDLVFSGRLLGAQEALDWGLVARVVDDAALDGEALAVAKSYSEAPTLALGIAKRMFAAAGSMTLAEFMQFEGSLVPLVAQSADFHEGTKAFLEKRPARFVGN